MVAIRTILCPVDFSSLADRELRMASQLCERLGARLVLHHTVGAMPPTALGAGWMFAEEHHRLEEAHEVETRRRLRELIAALPASVRAEGILAWGPLERMLIDLATTLPADLIVMGTHGASGRDHRSLTERVILDAPCPVLTLREGGPDSLLPDVAGGGPTATIATIVPVSFASHSQLALDYAFRLARRLPLRLHVLHTTEPGERSIEDSLRVLSANVPPDLADRVEVEVREEPAIDGILHREAELGAQLIVMGSHHRGWIDKIFSVSTARKILHGSPCPVWFVPERAKSERRDVQHPAAEAR
jgi:nucleotide-binding universal stress UspA family protein